MKAEIIFLIKFNKVTYLDSVSINEIICFVFHTIQICHHLSHSRSDLRHRSLRIIISEVDQNVTHHIVHLHSQTSPDLFQTLFDLNIILHLQVQIRPNRLDGFPKHRVDIDQNIFSRVLLSLSICQLSFAQIVESYRHNITRRFDQKLSHALQEISLKVTTFELTFQVFALNSESKVKRMLHYFVSGIEHVLEILSVLEFVPRRTVADPNHERKGSSDILSNSSQLLLGLI